jgi:16S rRNA (cytidine1402-2'-O)-methyltransferase
MSSVVYLIPTFLAEDMTDVLTSSALETVKTIDEFVVENEKSARAFLKKIGSPIPQSEFVFHELNEHSDAKSISELASVLKKNKAIGVLSEAGCPAVADPGSEFVRLAHEQNIRVIPLIGPSSMLLALMASGLNGQSYTFHGYLPRESAARKTKLKELERDALKKNQTQLFIETPYRNQAVLDDLLSALGEDTKLCVAYDLTSANEFIRTTTISKWKKIKIDFHKKPAVFLIGK